MPHDAVHRRAKTGCVVLALVGWTAVARAVETLPAPPPAAADAAPPRAATTPDVARQSAAGKRPAAATKSADDAGKPDSSDGRCDVCGGCSGVRTVCVPKPKDREIKKVCWSYKCEDVCIPGPSEYCGRKSGGKDECGCWWFDVWRPTCAEVRTKKVPVKTEVTRKVPGVEWSPGERCAACRCREPDGTRPRAGHAP